MSSRRTNNIEALSERLGFLQITAEALSKYKTTDTEISTALALATINENIQAVMLKSMVPDLG